jgi:UDP-glucose 4-epimerase
VPRVLITGGTGFIGRNLRQGLEHNYKITSPSSKELDLTDYAQVEDFLKRNDFDIILHTANWNGAINSTKNKDLVLEKNLSMFFNLTRLNNHFGKMIYYGSGAEYGMEHYIPRMKEEYFDTHVPTDQYGLSKYIMAKYTKVSSNIIDLRVFGCFGPYEDWELRFISNAICKAIYGLPITINQNVYFDYIWVEDLVRITEWFMKNQGRHKHYNACSGRIVDLLSLAHLVRKILKSEVPIHIAQNGLKSEYSGNNQRLKEDIPNLRFTPLSEAIMLLSKYYQDNLKQIDRRLLLYDKR